MIDVLKKRRTHYNINKEISVSNEQIENTIKELTEPVPDAFNMKSARVVLLLGEKHDILWDRIYDVFD